VWCGDATLRKDLVSVRLAQYFVDVYFVVWFSDDGQTAQQVVFAQLSTAAIQHQREATECELQISAESVRICVKMAMHLHIN